MKLKGQSAMEYLMAYGWAILVVVAVGVILWMMGVFSPSMPQQAVGFDKIRPIDWKVDGNVLDIYLANYTGNTLAINKLQVGQTPDSMADATCPALPATIGDGIRLSCEMPFEVTSGATYRIYVAIDYNNLDTGITNQIEKGYITGTAA